MAEMNFDKAIKVILDIRIEGGYVNDPNDPGGETKFGISKRAYPHLNIKELTLTEAKAIYKHDYWDKVMGDQLPYPLSLYVFDCAVNQGVSVAILTLQDVLGVAKDGVIGAMTVGAARASTIDVCALYLAKRALRYTKTANFDKYGKGWMKRLFLLTMIG